MRCCLLLHEVVVRLHEEQPRCDRAEQKCVWCGVSRVACAAVMTACRSRPRRPRKGARVTIHADCRDIRLKSAGVRRMVRRIVVVVPPPPVVPDCGKRRPGAETLPPGSCAAHRTAIARWSVGLNCRCTLFNWARGCVGQRGASRRGGMLSPPCRRRRAAGRGRPPPYLSQVERDAASHTGRQFRKAGSDDDAAGTSGAATRG